MQEELITAGTFDLDLGVLTEKAATLYGTANGQLEFVGLRTMDRKVGDRWQKFAVITFTDHDLQALPDEALKDTGLKPYYELTFPIA